MKMTDEETIVLTPFDQPKRNQCQLCEKVLGSEFYYHDGDAVNYCPDGFPALRSDCLICWGNCPYCHQLHYAMTVTIISDPSPSYRFFDDGCAKAQTETLYWSRSHGGRWLVQHLEHVSDLSMHGEGCQPSQTLPGVMSWVDRHELPAWPANNGPEAWRDAKDILDDMMPEFYRMPWVKT